VRNNIVDVRVVSPIVTPGLRKLSDLKALEYLGVSVSLAEIKVGPGSIESEFEAALSVPGTIAEIIRAQSEGVDAVVIDCMGDPGLRAAREVVSIPVLGPLETGMHIACMLGHRFSVLSVVRRERALFENAAAVAGVATKLASVRSIDVPVLELEENLDRTKAKLLQEGVHAVEKDGAEVLIFGCTGLMGCAASLREGLLARGIDVPVIDPIPTVVSIAAALVRSSLSHSKYTFPMPPQKELLGYDDIQLPTAVAAASIG